MIEILFSEKFWMRGDQANILSNLLKRKTEVENSDKFTSFKLIKPLLLDLVDMIVPVFTSDIIDTRKISSELFRLSGKYFGKDGFKLWEPYVLCSD